MEPRRLLDAAPLQVGVVFIEEDIGSDMQGDTFEVTFAGGAAGTQLTRLIIDGDQGAPGLGRGDMIFDTRPGGLGADDAFDFTQISFSSQETTAQVTASVEDGGTRLQLDLAGFHAGDKLVFSIDVDEVEDFDPAETDLAVINDGIDPLASGVEFQGSLLSAHFVTPHFFDVSGTGEFRNRYDEALAASGLDLPADDFGGKRDRSDGAIFALAAPEPLPVSIAGTVYLDHDLNLQQGDAEDGLPEVTLELWKRDGDQYVFTGHTTATGADGNYEFGLDLNLKPGTYQVREQQPQGLFSVGSVPGTVDGAAAAESVSDNPDVLTGIALPRGGQQAVDMDFAEARPASISGFVYHDRSHDGARDDGEEGIGGVGIHVIPLDVIAPQPTVVLTTSSDGSYAAAGLAPGTYRVVEIEQPDGFLDGLDTAGNVAGEVRGTAGDEVLTDIRLRGGDAGVEYNFGEILPGSISGRVHLSDREGNCEATTEGVTPLAGVAVRLLDAGGNPVATTATGADGSYHFAGLAPGSYTVVETTPDGLIDGVEHVGFVNQRRVGTSTVNDEITSIVLASGQHSEENNFCEHAPASLAGFVFHDRNDNGVFDDDEPPIAGVDVELRDAEGQLVTSRQTAADGSYAFENLPAGSYSIVEQQPHGWLDGRDAVGTIGGAVVGDAGEDRVDHVLLKWGDAGVHYDFGELQPGSIAGLVHLDPNRNCLVDDGDTLLAGVTVELLDAGGNVVASQRTGDDGSYRFDNLRPGVYTVREVQPAQYFHGGQRSGTGGGDVRVDDVISNIAVASAAQLENYNFCELEPSRISGFVFQDGAEITTPDGQPPADLAAIRDGVLTPDDTPIPGVVLELRDGLSGEVIDASETLPGVYAAGPVQVTTDADGFYIFTGLSGGRSYAVYQVHPAGFIDSIDTPGTTTGVAFNPGQPVNEAVLRTLVESPRNDAIVRIPLAVAQASEHNNFSEVRVRRELTPPIPPPPRFDPPPRPTVQIQQVSLGHPLIITPPARNVQVVQVGGIAARVGYTWHLSVIDAGLPRDLASANATADLAWRKATFLDQTNWEADRLRSAHWVFADDALSASDEQQLRSIIFGIHGGLPVAGDFNGDGVDEVGVFYNGEWFIDLNGNGRWDEEDLWAQLGGEFDLPVIGDWDGDGKDDIGIFGPEWKGDERAIEHEPGLPDSHNLVRHDTPKNVPPTPHEATDGQRLLRRHADGPRRADVIDHVFRFGANRDIPVAGDWNGDGIRSIGIFRKGQWRLDVDGDGRWTERDVSVDFGQPGDIPVVGDFDGNGVDQIGVYRGGRWLLDTNHNQQLDARDRVFEMGAAGDLPVVGDWDGDGSDEPGLYRYVEGSSEDQPPH